MNAVNRGTSYAKSIHKGSDLYHIFYFLIEIYLFRRIKR